jgi:hypothetical protein
VVNSFNSFNRDQRHQRPRSSDNHSTVISSVFVIVITKKATRTQVIYLKNTHHQKTTHTGDTATGPTSLKIFLRTKTTCCEDARSCRSLRESDDPPQPLQPLHLLGVKLPLLLLAHRSLAVGIHFNDSSRRVEP